MPILKVKISTDELTCEVSEFSKSSVVDKQDLIDLFNRALVAVMATERKEMK